MKLNYIENQSNKIVKVNEQYKIRKMCEISETLMEDARVVATLLRCVGIDNPILSNVDLKTLTGAMNANIELRLVVGSLCSESAFVENVKGNLPKVKRITGEQHSRFESVLYLHHKIEKVIPVAFSLYLFNRYIPTKVVACAHKAVETVGNIQSLALEENLKPYYNMVLEYCYVNDLTFRQFVECLTGVYVPYTTFEKYGVCVLPYKTKNILLMKTLDEYNLTLSTEQFKILYENDYLNRIIFDKDSDEVTTIPYVDDETWLRPVSLKVLLNPHIIALTPSIEPFNMVL